MTFQQYISKLQQLGIASEQFSREDLETLLSIFPDISIAKVEGSRNLTSKIIAEFEKGLNLSFVAKKEEGNVCMANNEEVRSDFRSTCATVDLLDYIYAVLHSPEYLKKQKEGSKTNFPRLPFPTATEKFWKLVKSGSELRKMHFLESQK